MLDVASARRQMVEQQVRAWDVLDSDVLEVMGRLPREEFAPPGYRDFAYADMRIPLAHGQAMLSPKVEGRILQSLAIRHGDVVLEIGTGSGWFAACLGGLARQVRSLEIFPDLAESARGNLARTGIGNVVVEAMDAMTLAPGVQYDVIALTGSLPVHDPRFEQCLAVGGRLFAVIGQGPAMEARLVTRVSRDAWLRESLFETVLDPLVHARQPSGFVF